MDTQSEPTTGPFIFSSSGWDAPWQVRADSVAHACAHVAHGRRLDIIGYIEHAFSIYCVLNAVLLDKSWKCHDFYNPTILFSFRLVNSNLSK